MSSMLKEYRLLEEIQSPPSACALLITALFVSILALLLVRLDTYVKYRDKSFCTGAVLHQKCPFSHYQKQLFT